MVGRRHDRICSLARLMLLSLSLGDRTFIYKYVTAMQKSSETIQ